MEQNNKNQTKNFFSLAYWKGREMDLYLGKSLRVGMLTACIISLIGGVFYMIHSTGMPNYKAVSGHHDLFVGVAPYLREFNTIFAALLRGDSAAIIQFGVLVLIATPIFRVAFSAIIFLIERDYLYVVITLIVLLIIFSNMIFGLH